MHQPQQLAIADLTLKGCSPPFRHTHHHVRKELHSLWLKGEVGDSLLLQRTLLKLTSKLFQTSMVILIFLIERQVLLKAIYGMHSTTLTRDYCTCRIKLEQSI